MKILLAQLSFLGDVVLSTPLIPALKQLHPEAEIHTLTTPAAAELLRRDPLVSRAHSFDKRKSNRGILGLFRVASMLRREGYESVYCLHRSVRSALLLWLARIPQRIGFRQSKGWFLFHEKRSRTQGGHEVERNLSLLGDSDQFAQSARLRLFPPTLGDLSHDIQNLCNSIKDYVVVVPGSVWETKRWDAAHYRMVVNSLLSQGYQVLVTGSEQELEACDIASRGTTAINLAGKTTISDLMYLISGANLVVCNDSMALHLASSFQRPTVAIFCATSPSFGFGPWKTRHRIVQLEGLWCKPCRRHGGHKCPTGTEACMKQLPPSEVWKACQELLQKAA